MTFNAMRYAKEQKEKKKSSEPAESDQDDFVEKVIDTDESDSGNDDTEKKDDSEGGDTPFFGEDDKPKSAAGEDDGDDSLIGGGGLLKILEHLKDVIGKGLTGTDPDLTTPISNPFEVLGDEDFDGGDETVQTFRDDLGGCKGMIRVIRIDDPKAEMKLAQVISVLRAVREASRNLALRGAFADIHAAHKSGDARRQLQAAVALTRLAKDSTSAAERTALLKAGESVLLGTPEHLDAAAFRVRGVFASSVPSKNLRVAYTTLRQPNQGEPVQQCPKAVHQLGRAETMPISVCRDQCIDSRVQRDGKVACAYSDWTRLADTHQKAMARLESLRHPDNAKNSLNLKEGERSKPLTEAERSVEQRMEEDLKGDLKRGKKTSEDALEKQLDDVKLYGHQGDADETVFSLNQRKASKKSKSGEIDAESSDNLGAQIEGKGHTNDEDFGDETIEEMLEDEHVGLSDSDIDKILEEWLDEARGTLKKSKKG